MNPVLRFVEAMNRGDIDAVASAFHTDFEMIVPQHPARGFTGREQVPGWGRLRRESIRQSRDSPLNGPRRP
jgi:SnoaL-like domain